MSTGTISGTGGRMGKQDGGSKLGPSSRRAADSSTAGQEGSEGACCSRKDGHAHTRIGADRHDDAPSQPPHRHLIAWPQLPYRCECGATYDADRERWKEAR